MSPIVWIAMPCVDTVEIPNLRIQGAANVEDDAGIDIGLMDVMMPEMDGYATTSAIRQIPGLAHLPVIAVTARAMHGDRDKSISAGATDYVTKPVDTEDLLSVMERWLAAD